MQPAFAVRVVGLQPVHDVDGVARTELAGPGSGPSNTAPAIDTPPVSSNSLQCSEARPNRLTSDTSSPRVLSVSGPLPIPVGSTAATSRSSAGVSSCAGTSASSHPRPLAPAVRCARGTGRTSAGATR